MANVFVTVGTHVRPFNRLLVGLDNLVGEQAIKGKVFAQIGHSTYTPANYAWERFLSDKEMAERVKAADIVVTHAGAGSLIAALKLGKKVVVVPRLAKLGEHSDDQQLELARALEREGKCAVALKTSEAAACIRKYPVEARRARASRELVEALRTELVADGKKVLGQKVQT